MRRHGRDSSEILSNSETPAESVSKRCGACMHGMFASHLAGMFATMTLTLQLRMLAVRDIAVSFPGSGSRFATKAARRREQQVTLVCRPPPRSLHSALSAKSMLTTRLNNFRLSAFCRNQASCKHVCRPSCFLLAKL